ncbi:alpha/beta hydrolase [Actinoallomurus acanthiterrae]
MTYAYDPELAPWVEMLPDVTIVDPVEARADMRKNLEAVPPYEPVSPLDVRARTVPGPEDAADVPVRIYRPAGRAGLLPGLLNIHGGGFCLGGLDTEHSEAARIAAEAGVVVVSVGYRLAPEHPFPAGLDDCYAALEWTAANSGELGIDPDRLGVGGESAGGGLAAAVALLARDRGGPRLCYQYLGIPALDDRLDTPSMRAFVDTPIWNRPNAELSWKYYLADLAGKDVSPYAAPARAEDLSGLPPACVMTCEFDPLRDEGLTYAQRLLQAGVGTEVRHYPGTFHGSSLVTEAAVSRRMIADKLDALRRGLRADQA